MKISAMLQANLQARDKDGIIAALMGYVNSDPKFETNDFKEAVRYTCQQGGFSEDQLFSPFNPELEYRENPATWDKDYYSYARVYLKENFCKKRINHVEQVARKLFPPAPTPAPAPARQMQSNIPVAKTAHAQPGTSSKKDKSQEEQEKSYLGLKIACSLAVLCAVIAVLIVLIIK